MSHECCFLVEEAWLKFSLVLRNFKNYEILLSLLKLVLSEEIGYKKALCVNKTPPKHILNIHSIQFLSVSLRS